jgi:hypothetical protein
MTKDPKYRNWGWQVFEAIEKHCKVPGGGYAGVESVSEVPVKLLDNMETFFLVWESIVWVCVILTFYRYRRKP